MTNSPTPRPSVATIPAYVAGRPPAPRPGLTVYKLSSNENPYPPLPGIVEAAERAVAGMNRYPDMGNTVLYDALSQHLGVPPEQLAAGTGSVAVVYHLLQAFCEPGDEVVYAWRSFEAYPIAVSVAGATSVQVPLTEDGRHDLGAMAAAVTDRTRVVLLCTPNNPTGPALTDADVRCFLEAVPPSVLVVVDEAYHEFVRLDGAVDGLALLRDHANVVLLRTFAKAYGMAGFRVGYAVAHEDVAAAVRAVALPFGVSTVAQATAVAGLAAHDELMARVDSIVEERERVAAGLADQGWKLPEAQGNFVWLPLGDDAQRFAAAAEDAGITVRPFAGDGVRVSIGEPAANDVFLRVAVEWLTQR